MKNLTLIGNFKGFNLKWKTFLFPNLSACPTGSKGDGSAECACTATGATTDGTADCKCAEDFQFNADKTACVGKCHRIILPHGGCMVMIDRSCKGIKGVKN